MQARPCWNNRRATRHQENGLAFSAAEDGCGGVYIVRGGNDKNVAVFKPSHEEVLHCPHIFFIPTHTHAHCHARFHALTAITPFTDALTT
jgi:hypothetical protein